MAVNLFDYQRGMLERIEAAFGARRSVMVQMPTGTGKTFLLAAVVGCVLQNANSDSASVVWIVAHRRELVAQIERTLARFGIATGERVKVLSIQWLSKHIDEIADVPGLIVIDEAHHALAKTYSGMINAFPDARKLGMTATPCRLNGKGFTDLFEVLLCSEPIDNFIKNGQLSPFDYVSIPSSSAEINKIDGLKKRAADGDYNVAEMGAVLDTRPTIERLYKTIADYAHDKKGIVYAINIEHAMHIAEYYQEQGLNAQAISSKTSEKERDRLVNDFTEGELQILVNVDIFSEGFDCPDVEFIQMARPTLSLAKYMQQVGRGLRVFEGKKCCVLLDNVGLYRLFGLPTNSRNWDGMFQGTEPSKGELSQSRIAFMNILESETITATTSDRETEMVVIISHDNQQERMELFRLVDKIGGNIGSVIPTKNGWLTSKAYIQKGNPYKLFIRTEIRNFGWELVQDSDCFYYTFQERKEELIPIGRNKPWSSVIDSFIKTNPYLADNTLKTPLQRHSEYIPKPRLLGTDDVHIFKGYYGLSKGSRMITNNLYPLLSKADEGVRVFKTENGKFGIMNQDGDYYLLWNKAYIELLSDGLAYVKDEKEGGKPGRWINLYTMQEFVEKPEVVKFGFLRMLKVGTKYYMLEARMMTGIPLNREDFIFNNDVFQFFDDFVILKANSHTIMRMEKNCRKETGFNYQLTDISPSVHPSNHAYIAGSQLPKRSTFI